MELRVTIFAFLLCAPIGCSGQEGVWIPADKQRLLGEWRLVIEEERREEYQLPSLVELSATRPSAGGPASRRVLLPALPPDHFYSGRAEWSWNNKGDLTLSWSEDVLSIRAVLREKRQGLWEGRIGFLSDLPSTPDWDSVKLVKL